MTTRTYTGSCHCGAVRFEADIDFANGTSKCNCSMCTKTRNWSVMLRPADFRLLTEESALSDYQFGTNSNHWPFCRTCGVRAFGRGYVEQIGGHYVSVKIASLDEAPLDEILAAPVRYCDGRNNNWMEQPVETRHL